MTIQFLLIIEICTINFSKTKDKNKLIKFTRISTGCPYIQDKTKMNYNFNNLIPDHLQ